MSDLLGKAQADVAAIVAKTGYAPRYCTMNWTTYKELEQQLDAVKYRDRDAMPPKFLGCTININCHVAPRLIYWSMD